MKAPFSYYGGKTGLASLICSLMPSHKTYLEPFFGSGAVLFRKAPATCEIVNDLDNNLVTFFRVLRDRPDELADVCALTPHARAEFQAADLTGDLGDLERARRFWARINQSFAKTTSGATGWSVTTARSQSVPGSILGRLGRFAACAERLMQVSIECCDAADLVDRLATPESVVYADPPYLASVRNGRGRGAADDFAHDMGDEDGHRRLAEALKATPATVLLSGYPSPLYDELYGDWWRLDVPVRLHSSNAVTVERGDRVEVVWSNRPLSHPAPTLWDGAA